ncbi:hypothetical protein [Bradyrhizobium sp. STM 3557]|uniref:hypothetical protein n=1 Tax=Bradyrhizobium sp. STM 3557 TaxID=578920 RepID=UPI00388D5DF9
MSCAKPLPGSRSFSVVASSSNAPAPRGTHGIRSSRRAIPAMVTWLMLEMLAHFTVDVTRVVAKAVLVGLSWLLSEFLAGCAVYAEAMYPVPIATDHRDNSGDQAVPAPAAVVPRPRLVVVSDTTRTTPVREMTRLVEVTGPAAVRDRATRQVEIVRSARAPAARRNNRPR